MSTPPIVERISRFIAGAVVRATDGHAGDDRVFDELAVAAFAFQHERIEPLRRLCARRGVDPSLARGWRDVPEVPVLAFKRLELCAAPAREVFRSSGTRGARSVHHHPFPELYRQVVDATFPPFCLTDELRREARPPMLSLVPSREQVTDSSLGFMVAHLLAAHGADDSAVAFGVEGVDVAAATAWCAARSAEGRPAVVLATAFALADWLDALAAQGTVLRLPPGSVVFETGGFKGRRREVSRVELVAAVGRRLGVSADRVVREYGMSELTSQLYTRALGGGDADVFYPPPWMRVRIVDPATLAERPVGEPGVVALFDLANVGSALHLLSEDRGVAVGRSEGPGRGGFRLLGRAPEAELRGCSLTVEELAAW